MRIIPRLAATTFAIAAALGIAGVGAGDAQAQPGPFAQYHWCPGQFWDPGWGSNWDGNNCHDDHHRDIDGYNHSRDWGQPGWQGGSGPPQQPWQR